MLQTPSRHTPAAPHGQHPNTCIDAATLAAEPLAAINELLADPNLPAVLRPQAQAIAEQLESTIKLASEVGAMCTQEHDYEGCAKRMTQCPLAGTGIAIASAGVSVAVLKIAAAGQTLANRTTN